MGNETVFGSHFKNIVFFSTFLMKSLSKNILNHE